MQFRFADDRSLDVPWCWQGKIAHVGDESMRHAVEGVDANGRSRGATGRMIVQTVTYDHKRHFAKRQAEGQQRAEEQACAQAAAVAGAGSGAPACHHAVTAAVAAADSGPSKAPPSPPPPPPPGAPATTVPPPAAPPQSGEEMLYNWVSVVFRDNGTVISLHPN